MSIKLSSSIQASLVPSATKAIWYSARAAVDEYSMAATAIRSAIWPYGMNRSTNSVTPAVLLWLRKLIKQEKSSLCARTLTVRLIRSGKQRRARINESRWCTTPVAMIIHIGEYDLTYDHITVVGAGLAGSEAAYQLAEMGIPVELIEMRPTRQTPAHHTAYFGELVCSNSLRAAALTNAVGLLKEEMRRLHSVIMESADTHSVPAGGALAVDRMGYAQAVTE